MEEFKCNLCRNACLIFVSLQSELTLTGYRKFLASKEAAPPLTEAEQERKEYDENQVICVWVFGCIQRVD